MGTRVRFVCMWQYNTWGDMFSTLQWAQAKFGGKVFYLLLINNIFRKKKIEMKIIGE